MKNLSQRVSGWSTLETAQLHGKIIEMQQAGEHLIDLTIGISDLPIPKKGEEAAVAAITSNAVPYTAIGGSIPLKKAIQKKLQKQNNLKKEVNEILVTSGAKQAIFEALYVLTNPGDEIMVFTPHWSAFSHILSMLHLQPIFLSVHDIASLQDYVLSKNVKGIIVNTPHNPTGKVLSPQELHMIAAFAKKHDLFVISDESYETLVYEGEYKGFLQTAPELSKQTITIFSVSQSFSMMGWRLGYAVGESTYIKAMESVQSAITAAPSAVTQAALAGILETPDTYTKELAADFKKRRDAIYPLLSAIPWITCVMPQSGPYFWCDISTLTNDSIRFCTELLKYKQVAVMPGDAFGAPGYIRIAFNVQSIPVLKKAVQALADFGSTFSSISV